jgi:LemA protein
MNSEKSILLGLLGFVLILGLWMGSSYNGLITLNEGVNTSWADVQAQYQRRADLIPNLVSTVQGAADFEQSTLIGVTEARTNWLNISQDSEATLNDQVAATQEFDAAFARLLVSVEAYPTLTATQSFRDLQIQLEGTENRISVARQDFNASAKAYNIRVQRFPGVLVAKLFNFEKRDLFAAAPGAEVAPSVDFNQE